MKYSLASQWQSWLRHIGFLAPLALWDDNFYAKMEAPLNILSNLRLYALVKLY